MSRYTPFIIGAMGALAAACAPTDYYSGAFSAPNAVAVSTPGAESMFSEPVGFVANRKGGRISVLALEDGRFMTTGPFASFVRGNPLSTGRLRVLSDLATRNSASDITVFAADQAFNVLLEIPYVSLGATGQPLEYSVITSEPVFTGTGQDVELVDLMPQSGFVGTEDWTVSFNGNEWVVEGTRSGTLEVGPQTGEPFISNDGALSFQINGTPSTGDTFAFSTDSGIIEHDLGGRPVHLAMSPDESALAVVVEDASSGARHLNIVNPSNGAYDLITLAEDSQPGKLSWSENGDVLYVTDQLRSAVWSFAADTNVPTEIILPWPTEDVAPLEDSLIVVPQNNREIWKYDLARSELVDLNLETPQVDGIGVESFIRGIESIPLPYAQTDVDGKPTGEERRTVAIALYSGPVLFWAEDTNCLMKDDFGPRTVPNTEYGLNFDYGTNFEDPSGPFLQLNSSNNRHVVVNQCPGIAKTEFWSITYDENRQGWEVEGSESGVQLSLAAEDTRYVSDDGAISFVIRSGARPSQDGQAFRFSLTAGTLQVNGDNNKDGQIADGEFNLNLPSDPVFFSYPDPQSAEESMLPMLLTASESSNFVARVNPAAATLEIIWE